MEKRSRKTGWTWYKSGSGRVGCDRGCNNCWKAQLQKQICEIFFSFWGMGCQQSMVIRWPVERNRLATPTQYSAIEPLSGRKKRDFMALSRRRRYFNRGSQAHRPQPSESSCSKYQSRDTETADYGWPGTWATRGSRSYLPVGEHTICSFVTSSPQKLARWWGFPSLLIRLPGYTSNLTRLSISVGRMSLTSGYRGFGASLRHYKPAAKRAPSAGKERLRIRQELENLTLKPKTFVFPLACLLPKP